MHTVKTLSHLFKHKLPCVLRVTVPICTYQVHYINIHTIGNQKLQFQYAPIKFTTVHTILNQKLQFQYVPIKLTR